MSPVHPNTLIHVGVVAHGHGFFLCSRRTAARFAFALVLRYHCAPQTAPGSRAPLFFAPRMQSLIHFLGGRRGFERAIA